MSVERTTNIAAIDAGSNAIRLVIARAESASSYHEVKNDRAALRLGHNVFTQRDFDGHTMDQAVQVFRRFKSRMNEYDVQRYRAVATSAAREARNRKALVDRIYRTSGIRLEVIDPAEEASLVRSAVLTAVDDRISPRMIVDLGGGSLQVSTLEGNEVQSSVTLSLGTVRMLEHFEIEGAMTASQVKCVREWVSTRLRRFLPPRPVSSNSPAVWCGGNAEALQLLAPGPKLHGIASLDLRSLGRKLPSITGRDVKQRMDAFLVRKDRAEVMGIAAIVLLTAGRWWKLERALVPGVGVKEGVLNELLRSLSGYEMLDLQPGRALQSARRFARSMHYDEKHCEGVRHLALELFDQLRYLHGMGREMRLILELGALLHDVGHAVRREGHHKHGEYLVRNAELPGLPDHDRDILACIVRYHSQSEPNAEHKVYASLRASEQRNIRVLVSLLRIADRLDCDHRQTVYGLQVRETPRGITLGLRMKRASELVLWEAPRGAALFEKEFSRRVHPERLG
jgi:exopolyphosphatase / guanosine-5'-triphosphate,3'-diphosphate pyrophosphatase